MGSEIEMQARAGPREVPVMSFDDRNAARQMQRVSDDPARMATDTEMDEFLSVFSHECTYLVDGFSVMVFGRALARRNGRLFRFVSKHHTPSVSNTIRLTSPPSYGHREQSPGAGVRFGSPLWLQEDPGGDRREGMFTLTEDLADELCSSRDSELDTKGLLHAFFSPGWILCTALVPDQGVLDLVSSRFAGKEAVMICDDHSAFAAKVGIAFGRYQRDEITRGTKLYKIVFNENTLKSTLGAIAVFHGPVEYMQEAERNSYLTNLAESRGPLVALETQFTKTNRFEGEHEYRFLMCGWGIPDIPVMDLPTNGVLHESFGDDGLFAPRPRTVHHLPGVKSVHSVDQEILRAIPWRVAQSGSICLGRDFLFPLETLSWLWAGAPMIGQPNELVNQLLAAHRPLL